MNGDTPSDAHDLDFGWWRPSWPGRAGRLSWNEETHALYIRWARGRRLNEVVAVIDDEETARQIGARWVIRGPESLQGIKFNGRGVR